MGSPTKLYTVAQAADALALRPSTIRKAIFRRQITVCRPLGRAVRVPESEILRIQREGLCPRRADVVAEAAS